MNCSEEIETIAMAVGLTAKDRCVGSHFLARIVLPNGIELLAMWPGLRPPSFREYFALNPGHPEYTKLAVGKPVLFCFDPWC